MKRYNLMYNVGTSKYVVNFHDGVKTHNDGSPFFDVWTFTNKKVRNKFIKKLTLCGYVERPS